MYGKTLRSYIPDIVIALILLIATFTFAYPFWLVLVRSFNDPKDLAAGGVFWWPRVFSTASYSNIFAMGLGRPLFISIARTVLGIITNVFCSSLLGYVLAQKNMVGRKVLHAYFLVPMYFGGGLIPWYLVIKTLGLINTFWVYIIPSMVSFYNAILMKVYIMGIPES